MTRLNWGALNERFYETGVDRGVLYVGLLSGVPWNGLINVSESTTGGDARPRYIDGYKFRNVASREEFEASIEAFAAPREFGACDGSLEIHNGLFATNQPRRAFHFSYRTKIGSASSGPDLGYKIHLVYNALAAPSEKNRSTMSSDMSPTTLSWNVTTRPPNSFEHRPTAHFIVDSRYVLNPAVLSNFESILYGDDTADARMPSQPELLAIFQS